MIDLEWVKDYIDIEDEDLVELAKKITKAGINVEKVITNKIDNLVIGKVIECIKHPDSDHLHVCKVDIGNEVVQIVCGALNVRDNIKVIVALPGAKLPEVTIKQNKIRGVISNGMICALCEIGIEEKTEINYNKGIAILDDDAKVGSDAFTYLNLANTIYELDIHKHRNNDCYYHIGFAYEIAAILNKKVKLPNDDYKEIDDNINNYFNLVIDTDKCSYYSAKMIKDVVIKESPKFIKRRLINAGMRPINNVVDISNYVMLEYGQPLHFFDKDKLGNKILVRDANNNEQVTTLDNKDRTLKENDIVITDTSRVVAIAGVMGALNTEVDESTKNILIEAAIFDPINIRNTANRLNLRSEASIRYGKGLNYEYTYLALNRACHLLEKYADAKILSGTIIYDKTDKSDKIIEFTHDDINKMLGIKIDEDDMKKELNRLDFDYEIKNNKFIVKIPKRRLDIENNVNDIAEEIGRLYGYHNLVSTLPKSTIKKGEYIGDVKYRKIISKRLRSLGLNETKTYTLISPNMANNFKYEDKKNIVLPNPMSIDKSVVRTTLIPSLLNTYEYNKARGVEDILIYEIAKTYDIDYQEDSKIAILIKGNYLKNSWQKNNLKADFYLAKGIIENLLDYLGLKNRYYFEKDIINDMHPGISARIYLDKKPIGIIGKVHPLVNKDDIYVIELSMNSLMVKIKDLKYKQASIYPSITKDVAFIVNKEIEAKDIEKTIKKCDSKYLNNIEIFDVYTSDTIDKEKKSLAFKLTFVDSSKTLTENEVSLVFNKIIEEVINKHNAILRDN